MRIAYSYPMMCGRQVCSPQLKAHLSLARTTNHLAGVAVVVIHNNQIVLSKGLEAGKLDLDADISTYHF